MASLLPTKPNQTSFGFEYSYRDGDGMAQWYIAWHGYLSKHTSDVHTDGWTSGWMAVNPA